VASLEGGAEIEDREPKRFLLRKKRKRPTIVFVDMEIMRTLTSYLVKRSAPLGCFLLCAAAPTIFASDVVLQKVPNPTAETVQAERPKSDLSPQASFALINYSLRTKAHALYVSSGNDLKLANNMIDDQAATTFGFAPEDNAPTTVIDLGKVSTLRRISAVYSARAGAIDFYVMQSLPGVKGENNPDPLKLESKMFANLKPVGSAIDDGTQGRASIDFPATTGRYIMLRWSPASHADTAFTVAEVSKPRKSSRVEPEFLQQRDHVGQQRHRRLEGHRG
jgi:hypothetical protein